MFGDAADHIITGIIEALRLDRGLSRICQKILIRKEVYTTRVEMSVHS